VPPNSCVDSVNSHQEFRRPRAISSRAFGRGLLQFAMGSPSDSKDFTSGSPRAWPPGGKGKWPCGARGGGFDNQRQGCCAPLGQKACEPGSAPTASLRPKCGVLIAPDGAAISCRKAYQTTTRGTAEHHKFDANGQIHQRQWGSSCVTGPGEVPACRHCLALDSKGQSIFMSGGRRQQSHPGLQPDGQAASGQGDPVRASTAAIVIRPHDMIYGTDSDPTAAGRAWPQSGVAARHPNRQPEKDGVVNRLHSRSRLHLGNHGHQRGRRACSGAEPARVAVYRRRGQGKKAM